MHRVLLLFGDEVLESLPFDGRPLEVGRARGNDLVVPDSGVADFHLVLRRGPDGPVAVDRTGRGLPDGDAVSDRMRLEPGTRLALGRFALTVVESAPDAPEMRQTCAVRLGATKPLGPLALVRSDDPTSRYEIRPSETWIGSAAQNHVVLADRFVSAMHCRIRAEGAVLVVRDLESRNGTFVNGVRVSAAEIHPGTRLRIGATELFCRVEDAAPDLGLVGRSEALTELRREVARLAPLAGGVLVTGESGSGKELVARALHAASRRGSEAFVTLNCAALAAELVESELFGHERGAFTGAASRRRGAFEMAYGGTLFLDEIGDLPIAQQAKLLRVLEERAVRRVGGEVAVAVDVRVVAATNVDLRAAALRGAFREDLFHRLAVLRVRVPPLRDRPEDIEPLAAHFLESFADELGVKRLAVDGLRRLARYVWPGNVRELRNVLYRGAAHAPGVEVGAAHLVLDDWLPARVAEEVGDPDRERIGDALAKHGGVVSKAARELGVSRETLRDRLRTLRAPRE